MLRTSIFASLLALAGTAAPLSAADLSFCWKGANGYTMTGQMRVPDHLMSNAILTEDDVSAFKIAGYHHGQLLGTWDMQSLDADDTWHLRFDPISLTFLTGDRFASTHSQGWNADGDVQNCGSPGFGFNAGNYAQDICLNGQYVHDSSITPDTPLIATTGTVTATCATTLLTGKSPRTNHSD